jgi:hypothetical protein
VKRIEALLFLSLRPKTQKGSDSILESVYDFLVFISFKVLVFYLSGIAYIIKVDYMIVNIIYNSNFYCEEGKEMKLSW